MIIIIIIYHTIIIIYHNNNIIIIYTYAQPRCRTLQYSRIFIPFSVSLWNDLASSVFDGVGLTGFKSWANASLLA